MERTDDTGFGGIKVIQRKGLGYGVDAILLASFAAGETGAVPVPYKGELVDMGTGCGIVAFVIAHKLPGTRICGIDVSEDAVERAQRACAANGLEDRVCFIRSDIKDIDPGTLTGFKDFSRGKLDAVVSNPPYFRRGALVPGQGEPDDRYIARHETTADARDFIRAAASMLRDGGSLYMVHRPDRLADLMYEMRLASLEPKDLQFVVPVKGKAANIVLIRASKNAGPELRLLPEIAVRKDDGAYTEEIMRFYERIQDL